MRYFNYPYNAVEELLVNAVFHKSYREPEPVEIRIYVDSIVIINYPGLAKWINLDSFVAGKAKARKYRNRRIGELFKEIHLSEKQGTGITKVLNVLKRNGSPLPEYEMDDERTYLQTTLRIREGFENLKTLSDNLSDKMNDKDKSRFNKIVEYLVLHEDISSNEAAMMLEIDKQAARRLLLKAVEAEMLVAVGANKNRKYRLLK